MAQPRTAPGGVQLPPEVAALAFQRQLGPHLHTFLPKQLGLGKLVLHLALILVPLAVGVAAVAAGIWVVVVLCLFLAGLFGFFLFRHPNLNPRVAARRVHLFQNGFVHDGGKGLVDYRWDAIAWVQQKITEQYYNGVHVGTFHIYTVARKDGPIVKLTVFFDGIADLGRHISEQVTRVKLPNAIALVEQGQTVSFGDLAINAQGLVSSRHGLLPWRELEQVQVVQGYVKLRKAGKWLAWSNKPAADIPNLYVFLTLASVLQRAARGG